ncbi:TPA: hypothetical protein SIA26_004584 [Aeromonas bestiarum]|nr:hypothetical protein [Aeromonas bestiarum]HEH9406990.1 hypothetical protein [Aeromonas bestiarum]
MASSCETQHFMAYITVHCLCCHSDRVYRHGQPPCFAA